MKANLRPKLSLKMRYPNYLTNAWPINYMIQRESLQIGSFWLNYTYTAPATACNLLMAHFVPDDTYGVVSNNKIPVSQIHVLPSKTLNNIIGLDKHNF